MKLMLVEESFSNKSLEIFLKYEQNYNWTCSPDHNKGSMICRCDKMTQAM